LEGILEEKMEATARAIIGVIFDAIPNTKHGAIPGANSDAKSDTIINNLDCAQFFTGKGVQFVN
jgi:hypothetical protein